MSETTTTRIGGLRRFFLPLRNENGAFDLPSIMVGVGVIGILAAAIMGSIFGVIPWAQDNSAKQSLQSIASVQGVYYAQSASATGSGFADKDALINPDVGDPLMADSGDFDVVENGLSGTDATWGASVLSGSGKIWVINEHTTTPVVWGSGDRTRLSTAATEAMNVNDLIDENHSF